jgi:hypothetical protein
MIDLVLLAAARLSETRLIDNICFSRNINPLLSMEAEAGDLNAKVDALLQYG